MADTEDFNGKVIEEFRANGGKVGGWFEGQTLLLLHHTGAKSGAERVNPLGYQQVGDSYAIFASAAGGRSRPGVVLQPGRAPGRHGRGRHRHGQRQGAGGGPRRAGADLGRQREGRQISRTTRRARRHARFPSSCSTRWRNRLPAACGDVAARPAPAGEQRYPRGLAPKGRVRECRFTRWESTSRTSTRPPSSTPMPSSSAGSGSAPRHPCGPAPCCAAITAGSRSARGRRCRTEPWCTARTTSRR